MSMNVLFLDDNPDRWNIFKKSHPYSIWVETANECTKQLQNHMWDEVHLDHDLNNEVYCDPSRKDTGMEVVRFIENNPINKNTNFIIHSLNSTASILMIKKLRELGYNAIYHPFGSEFDIDRECLINALCNHKSINICGLEDATFIDFSTGNINSEPQ